MPKLRNKNTGVVVDVSDTIASRLGPEWEPVKPVKAKPAKK